MRLTSEDEIKYNQHVYVRAGDLIVIKHEGRGSCSTWHHPDDVRPLAWNRLNGVLMALVLFPVVTSDKMGCFVLVCANDVVAWIPAYYVQEVVR